MTRVDERVTVWVTDEGIPQRLVWRARRFRVSDVPTRLAPPTLSGWQLEAVYDAAITHPPTPNEAWRFQGTAESGETLVFDVSRDPWGEQWRLLRTYD